MAGGVLGIDGLISGLDTTNLINQLMQIEAAPQTLLKNKQSDASAVVSALQSLNTKFASLADAATKATKPESWQSLVASSSSPSVQATTTSGGMPTQIVFTVDQLAGVQVSVTPAPVTVAQLTGDSIPPKVVFEHPDGSTTEVSLDGVTDVRAAAQMITASDAGVSATAVQVAPGEYRLQLSATESGAAGAFTMKNGDGVAMALATVSTAQDAKITLWPFAGASQEITSSSNTFADALPGLSLTVSAVSSAPVTVTTSPDASATRSLASDLVDQVNLVLSEITSRTTSTTSTDSDGRTVVSPGMLSGQSLVRNLSSQVSDAASFPVTYDGKLVSPSTVGIEIDKYGAFSFDAATFDAAYAADPEKVQAIVSTIASRVADVATSASDQHEGTLTLTITSQQDQVKDLGEQISDWDLRLEMRREALQQTYTTLETSLATLQSQSSWLSSQVASLPNYSQYVNK